MSNCVRNRIQVTEPPEPEHAKPKNPENQKPTSVELDPDDPDRDHEEGEVQKDLKCCYILES